MRLRKIELVHMIEANAIVRPELCKCICVVANRCPVDKGASKRFQMSTRCLLILFGLADAAVIDFKDAAQHSHEGF